MSLGYKYGLFPKGGYKAVVLAKTKKEAEKYRYGKNKYLEVREIIQ
jgi:hypothetical protein